MVVVIITDTKEEVKQRAVEEGMDVGVKQG